MLCSSAAAGLRINNNRSWPRFLRWWWLGKRKGGARGPYWNICLDEVGFPIGGQIPRQPPPELNNIVVSFLKSFCVMMRLSWWWGCHCCWGGVRSKEVMLSEGDGQQCRLSLQEKKRISSSASMNFDANTGKLIKNCVFDSPMAHYALTSTTAIPLQCPCPASELRARRRVGSPSFAFQACGTPQNVCSTEHLHREQLFVRSLGALLGGDHTLSQQLFCLLLLRPCFFPLY